MKEESESAIQPSTEGAFESVLSNFLDFDAIPLPPQLKRSFWTAVGRLLTGLADVPAAKLEAISDGIRVKSEADRFVALTAAKSAAAKIATDPALIDRSVDYFGAKILREQKNREDVAKLTVEQMRIDPPTEDAETEIDEDWLNMFERIASEKSSEEMKGYLAKILAGEIRKPGSFSPVTINTLANLTAPIAQKFQAVANMSCQISDVAFVIASHVSNAPNNGLPEYGISYLDLTVLQSYGLLASDLNSTWNFNFAVGKVSFDFGGVLHAITQKDPSEQKTLPTFKVVLFSPVGIELRRILSLTKNEKFSSTLTRWLDTQGFALPRVRIAGD